MESQQAIESDHWPLSYTFGSSQAVSPTASSRIKRWALTLSVYSYTIIQIQASRNLVNVDVALPTAQLGEDYKFLS